MIAVSSPDANLDWSRLFPASPLDPDSVLALARTLTTAKRRPPVCLEVHATGGIVSYWLATSGTYTGRLATAVRDELPGSMLVPSTPDRPIVERAAQVRLSSRHRNLDVADPERIVRALLSALTLARRNERLVIQLLLGPGVPARVVPTHISASVTRPLWQLALNGPGGQLDSEARAALKDKRSQPGVRLAIRLGVVAGQTDRQRALLAAVLDGLRSAEAPGVGIGLVPDSAKRLHAVLNPWRWPLALGAHELVPLTGLPVGDRHSPPLPGQPPLHPRLVPPTSLALVRPGDRIVAEATAPGYIGKLLGFSERDSRYHSWYLGPTGGGKSTLLLNLILQILDRNLGVVVIEPKDLIRDLLSRIPKARMHDVVLIDGTDDVPVGLNPLQPAGRPPELVADQVYALISGLYDDELGPRSSDLLRQCLAVLTHHKNVSLVHLALMLQNPGIRRSLTRDAMKNDPLVAGPYWTRFEALTSEAQATIVTPLGNKLRPLLSPYLRRVVGQSIPRLSIRDAIRERKIVLVPLQPGVIGPDTAELLAAVVLAELWQVLQERVALPEGERHTVGIFVDEAQKFLKLPTTDLSDTLAMSRSLGGAFHLANQFRSQLSERMLAAFDANARTRFTFQLAAKDATAMAAGQSVLEPLDFTSLPAHHIYASLLRDGQVHPWASGRTLPPPPKCSDPAKIRRLSREQYGTPLGDIEASFTALLDPDKDPVNPAPDAPIGGRRPRRTS